jgi:hypothetical protein
MANRKYACALAAALLTTIPALAQVPESKVEIKGLRDASKWFRVESQHFIVYSDSGSDDVIELINNLERLDYLLRVYTKPYLLGQTGAPKLTLYFQDRVTWQTGLAGGRPPHAIGLFNSCTAGVQAFTFNVEPIKAIRNEHLAKERLNEGLSYIFEAYARHFLYRHTDIRAPESFIEGFAQYFSSVRFTDNQLAVGRAPTGAGRYLHHIDNGNVYELTFDQVLGAQEIRKPNDPVVRFELLARSWNLVHYMLSSEQNREKMVQYLTLVHDGDTPAKAFAAAYGLSGSALDKAMWRHRLTDIRIVHVDVPELPQATMDFTALTSAAGEFVLADATLKSCPSRREGEALLSGLVTEAAKVPAVDFAQLTLSRAQIDWGEPRDALGYLTAAARRDALNTEVLYLLGLANLKLAERAQGSERDRLLGEAQRSLDRAASLKPGAPDVSFALYRAELLGRKEPAKPGVARAITAWRHGHEVPAFSRSAALAFAWMGDAAGAYRAFSILANDQRDEPNAAWAKTWLGKLGSGVPRQELLAAMRSETAAEPVFKEWTVAHVDVMKDVARKSSLDKASAFLQSMTQGDPSKPETMSQTVPRNMKD